MRIPFSCIIVLWIALVGSGSLGIAKSPLSNSDVLLAAMKIDQALDEMVTADHNQKLKLLDEVMQRDEGSISREEYNERLSIIELDSTVPGLVSDEIFVRRAYLDIVGCIPSADETSAFLKDTRADRRHRLVDTLLVSSGHTRVLFTHVASLLRLRDEVLGASQAPYIAWVRKCIEANMPCDKFVQELLTSSGTLESNPATGFFFRDQGQLFGTAAEAWRAFLNIDLTCACCHDHPFCDFTQRHFYEMAAVFSKTSIERVNAANGKQVSLWPPSPGRLAQESLLQGGEALRVRDTATGGVRFPFDYKYRDGKALELVGSAAVPRLDGNPKTSAWKLQISSKTVDGSHIRKEFVRWLTSDANPRFASTIALSLWEQAFGGQQQPSGLIEAPDDDSRRVAEMLLSSCDSLSGWRSMNATNPENLKVLANALTDAMLMADFDLRAFERVIYHTAAYQREAVQFVAGAVPYTKAAPALRRMSPEQVWDSLAKLTNVDATQRVLGSADLPFQLPSTHLLRQLGGGRHESVGDSKAIIGYDTALAMMKGELPGKAADSESALVKALVLRANASADQIDHAFLSVLSRHPTDRELQRAATLLEGNPEGAQDLVWALINTSEFLFRQ